MGTSNRLGLLSRAVAVAAYCLALSSGLAVANSNFGRIVIHDGDRQLIVGPTFNAKPYAIKATTQTGAPLAGLLVIINYASSEAPCPFLRDEFGAFGFNYPFVLYGCELNNAVAAVTDESGVVSLNRLAAGPTPSSFLMGAAAQLPVGTSVPDHARRQFFTIVRAELQPAGNPVVVVEFFHEPTRHYFNTILQPEIDGLDRGVFSGWTRSVGGFIAWASAADAPPEAVPVCRFFSSKFTSHFYTADATECDEVVERYADEWVLETREAYFIHRPDKATGACIAGTMPVYRVFSAATRTPNHRYVTDRSLRDTMVSRGWIAEGYGPDAVIMCTPR